VSETFRRIRELVGADNIRVSRHAFRRMGQQSIVSDDRAQRPIHAVWGLQKDTQGPAVLVTAYRPDPLLWSDDFRSRRS
jgi:hypothetical protein